MGSLRSASGLGRARGSSEDTVVVVWLASFALEVLVKALLVLGLVTGSAMRVLLPSKGKMSGVGISHDLVDCG